MKNFTRLISLAFLSLVFGSASAQYDIAVTSISTIATASNEIAPNIPVVISIGIENLGVEIPDQTTFSVAVLNNGDTVSVNHTWYFDGNYPNGGSGFVESNPITFSGTPPNANLCGFVILHVPDVDTSNNYTCSNYTVSTAAQTDVSGHMVFLNTPSNLDSFDLDNGENDPDNITDVNLVIKNVGTTIIPAGYVIPYGFEFDGQTNENFQASLAENMNPGDSTIRPSVDPNFNVDDEVGTYSLCGYVNVTDADNSNNEVCTSFTLIDSYIPPPPVGVSELTEGFDVSFTNDYIKFQSVSDQIDASIIDMNGRVIMEQSVNEDMRVDLGSLNAGVYFLQTVNSSNGNVEMNKFSKF